MDRTPDNPYAPRCWRTSTFADAKDLIVASHGTLHLHGDFDAARRSLHGPMLDLKGFHRLCEFGRPTRDIHPITETEIPVGEPNHGDTHPVQVIGDYADLLFLGRPPGGAVPQGGSPSR